MARALADVLDRFLEGKPILARPFGPLNRAWLWCKRNRVVAGLLSAVFVSLIVGTAASSYFAIDSDRRAKENLSLTQPFVSSLNHFIRSATLSSRGHAGSLPTMHR